MTVAMKALVDAEERRRIQEDLDATLVVEAAAGTGKTTELVSRIIAVLAEGRATISGVVAVTFTEKAAGEMKLRLREGLEKGRREAPAGSERRERLVDALAHLEEARVGSIHAFCADLLRERSVEAGVDPRFEVLQEPEARRLYREAFDGWLQEKLGRPPEGVRRSLRRTAAGGGDGPVDRLRGAGWTLVEWRDHPAPWTREAFDRAGGMTALVERLHAFTEMGERCARKKKDALYLDTQAARRLSREIRRAEEVRGRDEDGVEAALADLARHRDFSRARKGYGKSYGEGLSREDMHTAWKELREALRTFQEAADADLAACLQGELRESIERYEALKRRAGRLDFVDLLVKTRDLLKTDAAVRKDFQSRFQSLFVDEFQDTDPLQAEILLLLAADDAQITDCWSVTPRPGGLFVVADPKQSIYRFRRADVGVYAKVRTLLTERGADLLHLTTSFRSVPDIQKLVNAAFAPCMDGDGESEQASYVPLHAHREETRDQPGVVVLPVPRPYGKRGLTRYAVKDSYPDAVGAFVHWLVEESGWTVTERDAAGKGVPIAPRHVCLLFRRLHSMFEGDLTEPYVRALEARGIPHLLVGGRSFHAREEVETLRTALTAIEWPDDELSVFATLHGSLFAIGDEELLEYRHRYRRLRPFSIPDNVPEHLRCVTDALGVLKKLHRGRNGRPVAETVNRLLEETRAHAGFVLRPSGEQALANVLHVAEQARSYESGGGISFRGFVERLSEEAEERNAPEAPILEEGSEGVRLMTVHKAKGLEFPVVVLADPTATLAMEHPGRTIQSESGVCALRIAGWSPAELRKAREREVGRDVAEGVRLCYVAATRARDLLVVPGVGDGPFPGAGNPPSRGGWVSPLDAAIYPEPDAWAASEVAPGTPSFGGDSVVDRPFDPEEHHPSVRPGRHRIGEHSVVWWDPSALSLGAEPSHGVRQQDLMTKEADPELVRQGVDRFRKWEEERRARLDAGQAPALDVRTATEWAVGGRSPLPVVEIVELPRARKRPTGRRFGSLVHAALATVPLDADAESIGHVVELEARILGAESNEVEAASRIVGAVLAHPLLERARTALAFRRETPVTADRDGVLVEGVVDLAFREASGWTVVDFKTDQEIEDQLDLYRRQVGLYASVIAQAIGEKAAAVLMRI